MTDYTPTTEEIRELLTEEREWAATRTVPSGRILDLEDFDRWLAKHDAEKRAEWEAEQGGQLTWDQMWGMPIGSVVLYDERPFQKLRQKVMSNGEKWQLWEGPGSAWLSRDAVDRYAPSPVVLLHQPCAVTGQEADPS